MSGIFNLLKTVLNSQLRIIEHDFNGPIVSMIKFVGYEFDSVEYSLQYALHRARFISCGDTFVNQRSNIVLLNSFDRCVRISIVIVLLNFVPFSCTLIFQYDLAQPSTTELCNVNAVVLSIFKCLFEQSDPFNN